MGMIQNYRLVSAEQRYDILLYEAIFKRNEKNVLSFFHEGCCNKPLLDGNERRFHLFINPSVRFFDALSQFHRRFPAQLFFNQSII